MGFAAAAPLYYFIRVNPTLSQESNTNILQDLHDGWKEFIAHSWVWSIVAQFTIVNAAFSGVVMILGPIVADASFGRVGWGIIVAAQSIGLIVGSFIALRWRPRRDLFVGVLLVSLCAVPIVLLSVAPSTTVLMGAFFVAGVGFGQFGVSRGEVTAM